MAQTTRTYTFTDGTVAYGSQVDAEIANLVATWNNHDSGSSKFTTLQTTGQLVGKGTSTNDDAASGYIGEWISQGANSVAAAATGVYGNIASINLTAGDWDVSGVADVGAITTVTRSIMAVSAYSGNTTTDHTQADNNIDILLPTSGTNGSGSIPCWRVKTSVPVTIYLKIRATYASGSPVLSGRISARRVR